jgi:hypothetical protein
MLAQLKAGTGIAQQMGELGFPDLDRFTGECPAVDLDEIEGDQMCLRIDLAAAPQEFEHGKSSLIQTTSSPSIGRT